MCKKLFSILLLAYMTVPCFSQKVKGLPIDSIQNDIIREFESLDDWLDCYQRIIDHGNDMPYMEDCYKTYQNLVDNCSCQVWVYANMENGLLHFHSYTDELLLNGLISYVTRVLNGHSPEEILISKLFFIEATDLEQHISHTRYRDLLQVIIYMRQCAMRYMTDYQDNSPLLIKMKRMD